MMMTYRKKIVFLLWTIFIFQALWTPFCLAQNAVDLTYRFKPGMTFYALLQDTETTSYQTPQSESNHEQKTISQRAFKVLSVDSAGTADIEMKIIRIKTSYTQPDESIGKYDTQNEEPESIVAQLLLHPVVLKIDKKGHILSATGISEEELDQFYSTFKPASDLEKFSMDMLVSTIFSEENLRQILPRFIFPEYPETAIEPGASWSRSEVLDFEKFKAKVTFTYTLGTVDATNGQWQILLRESVENTQTPDPKLMAEFQDASSQGTYSVQAATGLIQQFALDTGSRFSIYQKLPDGARGDWALTRTSQEHYTMDLGKKEAELDLPKFEEENAQVDDPKEDEKLTGNEDFHQLLQKAGDSAEKSKYQTAEALLLLAEKKLPPKAPFKDRVQIKIGLGSVYTELGKYTEGEAALKQALIILAEKPDPDGEDFIYSLLSRLYYQQKNYAKAEPAYLKVLALRRRGNLEHPLRYQALMNYAIMKRDQHDYAKAESLMREALKTMISRLGPTHLDVAFAKGELAEILYRQKKYEEALGHLLDSLSVLKNNLPTSHPHQAIAMKRLATVYIGQAQSEKALSYVKEGILVMEKALSHLERNTPQNLPDIRLCRENLDELNQLKKQLDNTPVH